MSNPRYANGNGRRKLRRRLASEERGCWICRAFGRPDAIDYSLPSTHPLGFVVDELTPVARWREGGYESPTACALDPKNVDAAHRCCNLWRSDKSVDEVYALARAARCDSVPPMPVRAGSGRCTRDW